MVVVVDVQARHPAQVAPGWTGRPTPSPARPSPRPRSCGCTQTPWISATRAGQRTDLGLEHHRLAVEPGVGPPGADQFGDPGAVAAAVVAGPGIDADLLGEHRDRGREVGLQFVRPDQPDVRVDRTERVGGAGHQRLVGAHVAGRTPPGFEPLPQRQHQVGRSEDGGALAAPSGRDVGERPHGATRRRPAAPSTRRRTAARRGRRRCPRTGRPWPPRSSRPARTGPPPCRRTSGSAVSTRATCAACPDRAPGRNWRSACVAPSLVRHCSKLE